VDGATKREFIKCPDCNGGARNRKVEFRQGTVGAWYSSSADDECDRCKGDGIILRPNPKDPMT